jgi:transcriptional regulator with XRE-family HTH domain
MENISKLEEVKDRDLFYYRQRSKNRLFEALTSFFAEEAERRGITKRDIAESLHRDPAQITRWLTAPSNLTLDTISDLLLSLGAEMDYFVMRFEDRPRPNEMHPLMERLMSPRVTLELQQGEPQRQYQMISTAGTNTNTVQISVEP